VFQPFHSDRPGHHLDLHRIVIGPRSILTAPPGRVRNRGRPVMAARIEARVSGCVTAHTRRPRTPRRGTRPPGAVSRISGPLRGARPLPCAFPFDHLPSSPPMSRSTIPETSLSASAPQRTQIESARTPCRSRGEPTAGRRSGPLISGQSPSYSSDLAFKGLTKIRVRRPERLVGSPGVGWPRAFFSLPLSRSRSGRSPTSVPPSLRWWAPGGQEGRRRAGAFARARSLMASRSSAPMALGLTERSSHGHEVLPRSSSCHRRLGPT